MRNVFIILLLLLPVGAFADAESTVVEIDIQGMTCAFCIDGLHSSLSKIAGVRKAEVSLKQSRARIELEPGQAPDIAAIRQAIIDAGFTPGDVLSDS